MAKDTIMTSLRIYYDTGPYIKITTLEEWNAVPFSGVQVIVDMEHKGHSGSMWVDDQGVNHSVSDRFLWTGDSFYSLFDWDKKEGTLIPDDQYLAIYNRACTDGNH